MVGRDGAEVRRERIKQVTKCVLGWLHKAENGEITLSRTLAELEAETGNTRRRLMEYLQNGHDRKCFIIDEENDRVKSVTES